jgi:hypothetical protein
LTPRKRFCRVPPARSRDASFRQELGGCAWKLKRSLTGFARRGNPARRINRPIRLTDEQLDAIRRAALPLAPADRAAFLEAVAESLRGREVSDGRVYLAIAEALRRYWRPPLDARRG